MEADARLRKKPPPDMTDKTLPLMLFVLDLSQPAWPWSQLEPLGFGISRVWISRKMHGDCYGEQIECGSPRPTCQQMLLGREGGSSPNIAIIVAFIFCAWMHT